LFDDKNVGLAIDQIQNPLYMSILGLLIWKIKLSSNI